MLHNSLYRRDLLLSMNKHPLVVHRRDVHRNVARRTDPKPAANQIALTGPQARFDVKRELNSRLPQMDYGMFFRAIERPEMREGMAAFLQKRPPEWPRS